MKCHCQLYNKFFFFNKEINVILFSNLNLSVPIFHLFAIYTRHRSIILSTVSVHHILLQFLVFKKWPHLWYMED